MTWLAIYQSRALLGEVPRIQNVELAQSKGKRGPAKVADGNGVCRFAGTRLTRAELSYLAEQWPFSRWKAHAVYCKKAEWEQ